MSGITDMALDPDGPFGPIREYYQLTDERAGIVVEPRVPASRVIERINFYREHRDRHVTARRAL